MEVIQGFLLWVAHTPIAAVAFGAGWVIGLATLFEYLAEDRRPMNRHRHHHHRAR
jgi:hypothetical protein